jgi:poly-gamma-glutamate capsule biosynthesis protein CapA/YwtB (metallophosphatase superfamily)
VVARHSRRPARTAAPRRYVLWGGAGLIAISAAAVASVDVLGTTPPTTTTTTTTVAAATTTTTVAASVTLSAVGDSELGNEPQLPANPATYLQPIRSALAAPIVFGNLEGTMTNATTSKCASSPSQCYAFRVPTSFASVYRDAGFTVLNSANNHSHDFGAQGVSDTSSALAAAGIVQAGLPGQIGVVREGSTRVAFVDFAPYWNTNNLLNLPAAAQLIARARQVADVVVVYMHAGAEGSSADHVTRATETYVGENRGNPYAFAHAAIDDGADLVVASGPHVLRGMEWYRGHLIDYSLGDFANYYDFATAGAMRLSAILQVTLSATGSFVSGRFTSVALSASGQPFVDPTRAAASFVNQLSSQDFGAAAATIAPDGAIARPRAG